MSEERQNDLTFSMFIVALEHISCLALVGIKVCSVGQRRLADLPWLWKWASRLAAAKEGLRLSRQQMKDDFQLWQLAVSALFPSQGFLPVMANSRACIQITLHMCNSNLMLYVRCTPQWCVAFVLCYLYMFLFTWLKILEMTAENVVCPRWSRGWRKEYCVL